MNEKSRILEISPKGVLRLVKRDSEYMVINLGNLFNEGLTREQTARKLGISRATLSRLEQAGKITPIKTTKRKAVFPADEVRRYLISINMKPETLT